MSGFVIANAYEGKLLRGGYFKTYMLRRFARLFPMWVLGLSISFVSILPFAWHDGQTIGLLKSSLLNLFFLPTLGAGYLFPTNVPGWSLFFEMLVNLVYGIVVRRLSVRLLCLIVLVSACAVAAGTLHNGTLDGGSKPETIYLGFARVASASSWACSLTGCHAPHRSRVAREQLRSSPRRLPWYSRSPSILPGN